MSHISIQIKTDNAAFDDSYELETARILRNLADKLENQEIDEAESLRDFNGNRVGLFEHYS